METSNLRVCMISAELAPWAKVGGLGDVMASLPGALRKCGVDVTLVMPRYLSVQNRLGPERALHRFPLQMRWGSAGSYDLRIFEARHPDGFCVLLVDCPPLFERAGIYQAPGAPRAYADSLVRWTALCRGALFGALLLGGEWDILHAHDMHAALTLCLVESEYGQTPLAAARRVLSIHNLAYQGIFPLESLVDMGTFAVGESIPALSPFEYYGSLNLMKVGLSYADGIHTVSPTYAYEIVEDEEKGLGLQGMLWSRRHRVMGILNGIDVDVWDPQVQEALVAHYDANNLHGKLKCREALQVELGWEEDDTRPMFGMVTRLTQQKGIELVLGVIPKLQEMGARLVVLGTGEKRFV
ncbi:MAG: glycogen/starch synthase, partial [Myxococcota bacterium]